MLLEARLWGLLRFRFGVRVGGVVDATCQAGGREVRVWGWSYQTLQDHLEMGQMDYQVWKWIDDGSVDFRIHVVSRARPGAEPIHPAGLSIARAPRAGALRAPSMRADGLPLGRRGGSQRARGDGREKRPP